MSSLPKSRLEPPPSGTTTPSTAVALSASVSSDGYLSPPSVKTLAPSPAPSSKIVDDGDEPPLPTLVRERSHGAKMRDGEAALELPHNNMYLVMTALALCMFLAALDQTIVSTALPSISADLGGSGSDYQWIGTAYLLTTAAFVPMWGRLSDVVGRKWTFYPAILIFAGGSAICAASQSMKMLIGARALQGIGGGGISTMVQIVLSDIVTLEQRGKYSAVMGATWGFASIAGPLFGGLLSDRATWRWCFLINLPTVAVAITMLWFFLHLNPHRKLSFAEFYAQFDFVGVLLLMAGTATLLAGFSLAEEGVWSEPKVIALLVVGVVLLALGALNECYTKRLAIIPPRLMKTRTTVLIFAITLIHGMCFINLTFYLPVYYQGVFGASALLSGIQMLPVVLGGSVLSFIGGPILTIFKKPRPFFWISTSLTCLGLGLMLLLDENSNISQQEGLPVIAGLAVSMLFQPPLIALQSAMPLKDMSTSTGAFLLFRMIGSAIGISIGGTILLSQLHARLAPIPNLPASVIKEILGGDYTSIKRISDDQGMQTEVRRALSSSVRTIWIVLCPIMGLAFIFSLFLRHYTLTRNYTSASKSGTANGSAGEKEKEAAEQDEDDEEKPTPEGKKKDAWASAEEGGRGRELDYGATTGMSGAR